MTTANNKYMEMEALLLHGRLKKTITEDDDDELSERMADLWWEMSEEERESANLRMEYFIKEFDDNFFATGPASANTLVVGIIKEIGRFLTINQNQKIETQTSSHFIKPMRPSHA